MQESRFLLCSFQFSAWAFTYTYKDESYNLHFGYNQAETKEKKYHPFNYKQSVMWIRPESQYCHQKVTLYLAISKFAEITTMIISILQQIHAQQGCIALSFSLQWVWFIDFLSFSPSPCVLMYHVCCDDGYRQPVKINMVVSVK